MQTRAARIALLALLLAAGTGAALFVYAGAQHQQALIERGDDVTRRIDRLIDAVADLGASQEAYVAPGQPDGPWLEHAATLVQQIADETAALRPLARSASAADLLRTFADATGKLVASDTGIRENLRLGDTLMAADAIFSDAHQTVSAMTAMLRELQRAEASTVATERSTLDQQAIMAVGGCAVLWMIGLLLLLPRAKATVVETTVTSIEPAPIASTVVDDEPRELPARTPAIDVAAAADLCTDIARVTTTAALPDLLARAAVVLDASGIILWMSAGEELFAVMSHGYDPRVISRLGPIGRHADNATATAWRTGEVRTVAGDMMSNGAIVAPLFAPDSCIGVLAAEIRHGHEDDGSTRAVTTMIAAQLASAVASWPAAGSASDVTSQVAG